MITPKQKAIISKHADFIKRTVASRAASVIPFELIEVMEQIHKDDKMEFCNHCPSSLYNGMVYIEKKYLSKTNEKKQAKNSDDSGKQPKENSGHKDNKG